MAHANATLKTPRIKVSTPNTILIVLSAERFPRASEWGAGKVRQWETGVTGLSVNEQGSLGAFSLVKTYFYSVPCLINVYLGNFVKRL